MNKVMKGACWGVAMLLTATARHYGIFDAQAADTLLLVLPIVAVLSLNGGTQCRLWPRKGV